jgi:hypothetical protein
MQAAKSDPEQIWQETGWYQGKDGQWRSEINDKASKLKKIPNLDELKPYQELQMNLQM